MPPFLKSTVGFIVAIVIAVAIGAGAVFAWKWNAERNAKKEIESIPAIAENKEAIDTATTTQIKRRDEYLGAAAAFRSTAGAAAANPSTPPAVRACYDAGVAVISKCDSLHKADTTLIALYRTRAELMEDEAVKARRGKLVQLTAAVGYEPILRAPAARVGVELNVSTHWSAIGTYDVAARLGRDSTKYARSAFVGLNYRFGGRNP